MRYTVYHIFTLTTEIHVQSPCRILNDDKNLGPVKDSTVPNDYNIYFLLVLLFLVICNDLISSQYYHALFRHPNQIGYPMTIP